jgi:hypothetical protein
MATTVQTAYDRVRLRLGLNASDPALTDANLLDFLNAGVRQADNLQNWWWNEKSRSFSTVDATASYAFASDHRKILNLSYGDTVLPFRTKLDMIRHSDKTGTPRFWTVESGQIKLFPTPDGVYAIDEVYQAETTVFTSASDVFVWPDFAADFPILIAAQLAASKVDTNLIAGIAPEMDRLFRTLSDESTGTLVSAMPQRRADWRP